MKRFLSIIILLVSLFTLIGCGSSNDVTVLIKNGDDVFEVIVKEKDIAENMTLEQLLNHEKYKNKFNADLVDGEFGKWIAGIYGITPDDAKGEYISVYTTVADYTYGDSIIVNEIEFKYATIGITELPVIAGQSYMFALESWLE